MSANAPRAVPGIHHVAYATRDTAATVRFYEELLGFRSPHSDPMGYARVLANQANALAHLGGLEHALEKYRDARELFERAGDRDAVRVVQEQVAQIVNRRTELTGDFA